MAKWQGVKDTRCPGTIEDALEREKLPSGRSYFSVLKGLKTYTKAFFKIADDREDPRHRLGRDEQEGPRQAHSQEVPFFKRIFALQAILEIEFGLHHIPFEMWMDFNGGAAADAGQLGIAGRLTVIRQYLRRLIDLTYQRRDQLSRPHRASTSPEFRGAEDPCHLARYKWELWEARGIPTNATFAPDIASRTASTIRRGHRSDGRRDPRTLRTRPSATSCLDSDLDACKLEVLRKAGIFDVTRLKALVIRRARGGAPRQDAQAVRTPWRR